MERFLSRGRSDRRPPPTHADLLAAAGDVLALLHNFQATADMPYQSEWAVAPWHKTGSG